MKIDREMIGERLKTYRKDLEMSQQFVCDYLSIVQSQLSGIEKGVGGGVELLCSLLSFYGKHYDLRNFFASSFEPLPKGKDLESHLLTKSELMEKKLEELSEKIDEVRELNKKKLKSF